MSRPGITTAKIKIEALDKRIRAIQGGSSAGKTLAIVLILIDKAQRDKKPTLTSIVSETLPHLKRGAMADFLYILRGLDRFHDDQWNKSDFIYTFGNGSKIEFFSTDQPRKVRGPRRDRLFINEANNVAFESFEQLEIRTKEVIYLDWNPTNEFWFYTEVMGKRPDVDHVILTYKDNEALDRAIIDSLEQRMSRQDWWRVYGEGLLGEIEGKIYKDWRIVDSVPHEARLISYGLDFGYTNDPTAICQIFYLNNAYIIHEIAYQKGLSNKAIADIIKTYPTAPVIADAAEPKSIDELRLYGITVIPSTKGKGSVNQRIEFVQSQRISITKASVNFIKDYRNYIWQTDKNGKVINVPEHQFSHGMDSVSYGFQIKRGSDKPSYQQPAWENPMQGDYGSDRDLMPSDYRPKLQIGGGEGLKPSQPYSQPAWQSPLQGDMGEEDVHNEEQELTGLRSTM